MKRLLTWLSRQRFPYEPLITVELSRSRLLHNLHEFQKIEPKNKVAPVLKSNAYGHGIYEIAHILEEENKNHLASIPFLIVDSYFEALVLRNNSIKIPLLIIGYTRVETIISSKLKNVTFTISSLEILKELDRTTHRPITIQIKIDTGMHRQGIPLYQIDEAINVIKRQTHIILEGICTHLADADGPSTQFTHMQIDRWNNLVQRFQNHFPKLKWFHASATYGHIYAKKIQSNVSRLGIGLYGLAHNFSQKIEKQHHIILKPILEIKSVISDMKKLSIGDHVGYSNTFTAQHPMVMATIPAGYYEGIDKSLANYGEILVGYNKIPCKIIGRVSMNITCIDVTRVSNLKINDPVVIISNNASDPNSIASITKKIEGSIPYDLVVKIPAHLKRVVV